MTFEPDKYVFDLKENETIKDYCSPNKDNNFKFLGFEVDGQISTFGVNEGPKGIKLGLFNSEGKKLETTVTSEGGLFKFKPLYPNICLMTNINNFHSILILMKKIVLKEH